MSEVLQLKQFRLMSQYNSWVNEQIYSLAASLSEEERRRDLKAFFQSIHGTLNHLLLTDRIWLGRFTSSTCYEFKALQEAKCIFKCESLSQELYANFIELRAERAETDAVLEAWIQELEPEMILTPMRYRNLSQTKEREHPLWFAIAHLFNHQTHHRGQVTTLLNQMGGDYGVTDFLAMYEIVGNSI